MTSVPTRVALLLTLRLDTAATSALKPLDVAEMTRLARWLQGQGRSCLELLDNPEPTLEGWDDRRIPSERVLRLLGRSMMVDNKIEQWRAQGVWVAGRTDENYPRERLRKWLDESRPPLLFGIGNSRHLDGGGTAIVGSRDATVEVLRIAERLGLRAARHGNTVVSGGARGVDERAVQGAFLGSGRALVVLGDSLLKNARKKQYKAFLENETLTLISPYSPDVGFTAGNAMGRNRLIYCLADEAIVVASTDGIGGTFGGAREAIRRGWGPMWVVSSDDSDSGNRLLLEDSAQLLPAAAYSLASSMYEIFMEEWQSRGERGTTIEFLSSEFALQPTQVEAWIAQGIAAGRVRYDPETDQYHLASPNT